MKTTLIKLQDKFILVSDEKAKTDCHNYDPIDNQIWYGNFSQHKKIIAGIPELPSIDFSELSEQDCKTIGWVDVERLAKKNWKSDKYNEELFPEKTDENTFCAGFYEGFKSAQSLNEKQFSLEDMNYIYNLLTYDDLDEDEKIEAVKEHIQSLPQTSWDVEVEMELNIDKAQLYTPNTGYQPKITNNSIKLTKIL